MNNTRVTVKSLGRRSCPVARVSAMGEGSGDDGRLCSCGCRCWQESLIDVALAVTVTFRGLCDCHQSPPSNGPRMTAMTVFDLAKQHQCPQRRAAQMRTAADVRTVVFMPGVKAEWHRHPARMPKLEAIPSLTPKSVQRDYAWNEACQRSLRYHEEVAVKLRFILIVPACHQLVCSTGYL